MLFVKKQRKNFSKNLVNSKQKEHIVIYNLKYLVTIINIYIKPPTGINQVDGTLFQSEQDIYNKTITITNYIT